MKFAISIENGQDFTNGLTHEISVMEIFYGISCE